MAHEYVFRGESEPFAPDPKDLRAREEAKREAEQLVNRQPELAERELPADAELEEKIGDYQVGGLDSFGASTRRTRPAAASGRVQEEESP